MYQCDHYYGLLKKNNNILYPPSQPAHNYFAYTLGTVHSWNILAKSLANDSLMTVLYVVPKYARGAGNLQKFLKYSYWLCKKYTLSVKIHESVYFINIANEIYSDSKFIKKKNSIRVV